MKNATLKVPPVDFARAGIEIATYYTFEELEETRIVKCFKTPKLLKEIYAFDKKLIALKGDLNEEDDEPIEKSKEEVNREFNAIINNMDIDWKPLIDKYEKEMTKGKKGENVERGNLHEEDYNGTKTKYIMGWAVINYIGLDNFHIFCHYMRELESYTIKEKGDREIAEINLQIAKTQEKTEKAKQTTIIQQKERDKELAEQRKIRDRRIAGLIVAVTSTCLTLLSIYQWFMRVKIRIVSYTNTTSTKFGTRQKVKGNRPYGIYNKKLAKRLERHKDDILEWAQYDDTKAQHLLLYGPPGSGKTLFLEYIAEKAGKYVTYYYTSGSYLNSVKKEKDDGAVQKQLLRLMDEALKDEKKKAIIIIDEVHLMSDDDIEAIQSKIKKITADKLLVLFATNHINRIPEAARSRFAKIYVGHPNQDTVIQLLLDAISHHHKGPLNENHMTMKQLAKQIREKKGMPRNIYSAVEMAAYQTKKARYYKLDLAYVWDIFLEQLNDYNEMEEDEDENDDQQEKNTDQQEEAAEEYEE